VSRAAPATSPSTRPADSHSRREQQLARLRSLGRWDFDYIKGRWVFVLPGDQ
jgi:hypothetical protein